MKNRIELSQDMLSRLLQPVPQFEKSFSVLFKAISFNLDPARTIFDENRVLLFGTLDSREVQIILSEFELKDNTLWFSFDVKSDHGFLEAMGVLSKKILNLSGLARRYQLLQNGDRYGFAFAVLFEKLPPFAQISTITDFSIQHGILLGFE